VSTSTADISARLALAQEYDILLTDIRQHPGFERFLLPKTFSELLPASKDGPIIFLNLHSSRCDALVIVSHDADVVIHVPLPELTHKLAESMRSQFVNALSQARVRDRAIISGSLEAAANSTHGLVTANAASKIS
jgi:hypothetical protein